MAYCLLGFGESVCLEYILHKNIDPVLTFKSLDEHKKKFFGDMVNMFSGYDSCYAPSSIDEIEERKVPFKIEFSGNKLSVYYDIQAEHDRFLMLSYGTSGGLSLSFYCLLYKLC